MILNIRHILRMAMGTIRYSQTHPSATPEWGSSTPLNEFFVKALNAFCQQHCQGRMNGLL
jgi:hypothetical protein